MLANLLHRTVVDPMVCQGQYPSSHQLQESVMDPRYFLIVVFFFRFGLHGGLGKYEIHNLVHKVIVWLGLGGTFIKL